MKTLALFVVAACSSVLFAQVMPREYASVLTLLGKKGDYRSGVFKLGIPRNDLQVRVAGVDVPTPFGFGGWIAMAKGDHGRDVMMGDLVLLSDEVNPVMSALLENGLEVTALHNHFFWEQPRIYYMHVHGVGTPEELAQKIKPAIDLLGRIPGTLIAGAPSTPSEISGGTLDTKALDVAVGATGELNGQVYKFTVGRPDLKVREMGATIDARMGLNSWAAFFGTNERAIVAGDIAMLEGELTSVLKVLRAHHLDVVAIHHHMTECKPMVIFLHYFGKGNPIDLARGFKSALDALGKKPGHGMSMVP